MTDYFALLSSLATWLDAPIADLGCRIGIPLVSVLLLALIGAFGLWLTLSPVLA